MIVRGVEFDRVGAAPEPQHFGAEQRDIVKMDYVGPALPHDRVERGALQIGTSGLMRQQRRQESVPAAQTVDGNPRRIIRDRIRSGGTERLVRIDAMNDVDLMAPTGERLGETIDIDAVAAERVGRKKRGEMKKAQRPRLAAPTLVARHRHYALLPSRIDRINTTRPRIVRKKVI